MSSIELGENGECKNPLVLHVRCYRNKFYIIQNDNSIQSDNKFYQYHLHKMNDVDNFDGISGQLYTSI